MKVIDSFRKSGTNMQELIEECIEWIIRVMEDENYNEWALTSDHYPFGVDIPFVAMLHRDYLMSMKNDSDLYQTNDANDSNLDAAMLIWEPEPNMWKDERIVAAIVERLEDTDYLANVLTSLYFGEHKSDVRMNLFGGDWTIKEHLYQWLASMCGLTNSSDPKYKDTSPCWNDCDGHCYDYKYDKRGYVHTEDDDLMYAEDNLIPLNVYLIGRYKKEETENETD
jgi:hypothetical protein